VDQAGGVEGLAGPQPPELLAGDLAQLFVGHVDEAFVDAGLAGAEAAQQLSDLGGRYRGGSRFRSVSHDRANVSETAQLSENRRLTCRSGCA